MGFCTLCCTEGMVENLPALPTASPLHPHCTHRASPLHPHSIPTASLLHPRCIPTASPLRPCERRSCRYPSPPMTSAWLSPAVRSWDPQRRTPWAGGQGPGRWGWCHTPVSQEVGCAPSGRSCVFWRGPGGHRCPAAVHAVPCRAIPGRAAMGTKPRYCEINSWTSWPGFCKTNLAGTRGNEIKSQIF